MPLLFEFLLKEILWSETSNLKELKHACSFNVSPVILSLSVKSMRITYNYRKC